MGGGWGGLLTRGASFGGVTRPGLGSGIPATSGLITRSCLSSHSSAPPPAAPPLSLRQFASAASLLFLFLFPSFGTLKLLGCGLYFAHSWVFFSSACIITVVRSVFVCLVSWGITLEMIYFIFFFPSNTFFFCVLPSWLKHARWLICILK